MKTVRIEFDKQDLDDVVEALCWTIEDTDMHMHADGSTQRFKDRLEDLYRRVEQAKAYLNASGCHHE